MSVIFSYKTIEAASEGLYKEKGSKFFAYAYPIKSDSEVKLIVDKLRKEHKSARHVCWAISLGSDASLQRSNDDGEPSGTAGKPILGQLHSFQVTNVLIAVVRYFGGTKLGASGLVTAYKTAAQLSLEQAKIIEVIRFAHYEIRFKYDDMGLVMNRVNADSLKITHQNFEQNCLIRVEIPLAEEDAIISRFKLIHTLELEKIGVDA